MSGDSTGRAAFTEGVRLGAGAILGQTGGHADLHGVPAALVADAAEHHGAFQLCDGIAECARAVRLQPRKNARVIKVCASGGVLGEVDHPVHQQFSDAELRAIVEEAGRAERVVAAHCHGKPGIMAALRAGQPRAGFDTDVIAVDGDPVADIRTLADPTSITHVWRLGRLVKPAGSRIPTKEMSP